VGSPAPRREAVAKGGQRERLIEGMTLVAARHGYSGATVTRTVEQAGISRATFYEHFADREDCFLAAFEAGAMKVGSMLEGIESECPPPLRAGKLLDKLLVYLAGSPAVARVLLVEALAGGPAARTARDQLTSAIETTLERWLRDADGDFRIAVTGRAVMEGVGWILVRRSFRGETARLADLRNDLLAWINSYAIPAERKRLGLEDWRRLGSSLVEASQPRPAPPPVAQRLPRGRSAMSAAEVAAEHRERVLAAVAQLARTKGYTAMTVADIVKTGSVSREAFYELFRDKEDAFLATQSVALERSISTTAAAFFGGEDWPARVWDGLEALLGYIGMEPDLVYLDVFESYPAGAAAIRRSFDNNMAYTLFLEDGYRQRAGAAGLPRLCSEAIGGAILGLLRWQVTEGRTERTLEVLPQAAYLALAPFVGPLAAIELVEAKVAEACAGREPEIA
jgi:AcrR family transcriptional regulator